MSVNFTQRYKNFSCISIGDKVKKLDGTIGQVIRINGLAESPELYLTNDKHYMIPIYDYHELEIIEPFDLYIFEGGTY